MKRYTVRVITNATQNRVYVSSESALRVRLQAKPIDGQANEKLLVVLADYFKVKVSAIKIVTGQRAKTKIIEVAD